MAAAVTTRAPKEVAPLKPSTRLTLTFRELSVEGKKDWRHCFLFARHAAENDEEMAKVMAAYDGLKKRERAAATPEFVCDLAGVDPRDFAAEVFREYLSFSGDAANLIAAAGLPEVVRKSVEVAKTTKGVQDRKMQFEHANFLPQKQGGGIHVNANASVENKSAVILPNELPSMESDTMRFTRVLKSEQVKVIESGTDAGAPARVPALSGE